MNSEKVIPVFVETIPDQLIQGSLYVSIPYRTMVHLCCCGCGFEVATPLRPTDWQLTYDGETISLSPSIGNWSLPCRSHYWIQRNQVRWAATWSESRIAQNRDAHQIHRKTSQYPNQTQHQPATPRRWYRRLFAPRNDQNQADTEGR